MVDHRAVHYADEELEKLNTAIRFAKQSLLHLGDEMDKKRVLLVDGSMYSPSIRAIGDSEWLWKNKPMEVWIDYEERLIDAIDNWSKGDGWYLSWDEGCLFLCGPDYEEDDTIG